MRGLGSQSSTSFVIRSQVRASFWLRRRSVRGLSREMRPVRLSKAHELERLLP